MEKMEKPNEIKENLEQDQYFFDKSFIDKERSCVCLPVRMIKRKNVPDIDISSIGYFFEKIESKFKDQNLDFTGKWDTSSDDSGVKEYLFFFKNELEK